jgi:hypothetical protein
MSKTMNIQFLPDDYLEDTAQENITLHAEDLFIKYIEKNGKRPSPKLVKSWVDRLCLAYEKGMITRLK